MKNILSALFYLVVLILFSACSTFENEEYLDNSEIDFLVGVEDSGKLKRELHYGSSDDETLNSDIVFEYENDRLVKKIYNDFLENSSYVLKQDIYTFKDEKLFEMKEFFRSTQAGPLNLSNVYHYYHPDANTKIEVKYRHTGELKDSIVFTSENELLVNEIHFSPSLGEWEVLNTYNNAGKLAERFELPGEHLHKNYFDESGLLIKSESIVEGEIKATSYYESEIRSGQLTIKQFSENPYSNYERVLSSQKKYEKGKLIEYINYHPTFPGSEWFCFRYEYY